MCFFFGITIGLAQLSFNYFEQPLWASTAKHKSGGKRMPSLWASRNSELANRIKTQGFRHSKNRKSLLIFGNLE
jgi:hypothetical protein